MKYLKRYDGEFLGIVGEPTDMTYADGSNICIGDLVDISGCSSSLIVTNKGITGFTEFKFKNGTTENLNYKITSFNNEHLKTNHHCISIHEATIHDIAVKCATVDEKFNTIKLMQRLNGQKENTDGFSDDTSPLIHISFVNSMVCTDSREWLLYKIIIDYPTFIQHFDNTKLEVEIKQIDNVVLKRLVKWDKYLLSEYGFDNYPLWHSVSFDATEEATTYATKLQQKVDSINSSKLYDSLGQELHEGDEVECMVKEAFSQGILNGKLEMFN